MSRWLLVLTLLVVVFYCPSFAQIGRLKDKLLQKSVSLLKEQGQSKLQEWRDKIDTASISLAVSFADNAGKFEQNDRLSNLRTFADGFLLDDQTSDPLEKARESNEMGELFYSMNQFWMAQFWLTDSKAQYENLGKTQHPQYFKAIANLGLLYHTMGRFNNAYTFTQQALELRKTYLGEYSTATAASLNNMAVIFKDQGLYSDAENYFDQAIDIFLSNDPHGSSYAIVLNNKAILYQIMGRLDEAEKLLKQSLRLANNNSNLKEKSNNYQRILVNLALLYQDKKEYDKAETIYLDAIKLKEKQLKNKQPDYAHLLNNLASLYMVMGKESEVEDLLNRSLDIYESKLGQDHPAYASTLSNLGKFYLVNGRTSEAKLAFQKVIDLRLKIYGEDHPQYVNAQEELALACWQDSEISKASELFVQVLDKELEFINKYFPPMTENEKAKYWDKARGKFLRYYAFVKSNYEQHPEQALKMFEYRMETKALLLNISNRIREEILNGTDEQLKRDYLLWLDKKETLVSFYSYTKGDLEKEKIDLEQIENDANELERSLSARSDIFRKGYASRKITYQEIQQSLSPSEAALEIIQANKYERSLLSESQYIALVITNSTSYPILISLDNGKDMDAKFFKYYKNCIRLKIKNENSYSVYWEPIDKYLASKSVVYISYDGIYNQLSINTLNDPSGKYVIDKYNLIYLTNSRHILDYKNKEARRTASRHATLIGFPNYGDKGTISQLPGTKAEIDNIYLILKRSGYTIDKYVSNSASEENLKYSFDPSILHIATHGYFLNDSQVRENQVFGIEPLKASENPLLRSGLFFSHAESAIDLTTSIDNRSSNNGVLTAYEAMNLHLNGTEIVVLSACETGLGDVKSGEGVYGLQRALQIAGADAVMMSLWKVDDRATRDLMVQFYTEWVKLGNKHQAFKKAQLNVKSKYPRPYYWGSFILVEN